ncbi:MAG: RDD family protein [Planctomycetes bacterium]|nr:RDD family protein [Planctomycetota bacterium]
MQSAVEFETPENIRVAYEPAGLGTRFVAWFVDNIIMVVVGFFLFVVLMFAGVATEGVFRSIEKVLPDPSGPMDQRNPAQVPMYFIAIWLLAWGLGSFFYYGCSELLARGQTIGKRLCAIRVVKVDGFSLDPASVLVRNLFRVADHLPPLWIVPVISRRGQRFGDMVAGTIVISDKPREMGDLRHALLQRPAAESRFRFDNAALGRARKNDFEAVEKILERWSQLDHHQQNALLDQVVLPLAQRLKVEPPEMEQRQQFLEDLLAAEYRRQSRNLG